MISKKVLFVVTEDWFFWMHRLGLAQFLKTQGFTIYLATRKGEFYEKILEEGFHFIEIDISRKSLNPLDHFRAIFALKKIINTIQPDIIHNVSIQPIVIGSAVALFIKNARIVNAFTGLGYIFIGSGIKKLLIRLTLLNFLRFIFSRSKPYCLFENSDDMNLLLKQKVIDPERSIQVPGSGVNLKRYHFTKPNLKEKKVLLASRMIFSKGIQVFVEAAKILKNKRPNYQCFIAGRLDPSNPDWISETILRDWEKFGFVKWLGDVADMPKLYSSVNIICLPTLYREGIPMVLIEGAAMGRPLIASNTTGCRDIVVDGKNGFLVEMGNPKDLAEKIEIILENEELMLTMGQESRNIAEALYDENILFAKILNLYHKMTSTPEKE